MEKIIQKSDKELINMSKVSAHKASTITCENWVESLMSLLKK
jgi:hypothetical protein